MDSSYDKKRVNVQGDRLSNLPDDLIHKILSCIDIKQAIEASEFSSRWRYMWTSMPCLNTSSEKFRKLPNFREFVTGVLSRRNNQVELSHVKLVFRGMLKPMFAKRIVDYAFSHNVQKLEIICMDGTQIGFPFTFFNSRSLKHLTYCGYSSSTSIMTPSIWELPALTTLVLERVTISDDNTDKCVGLLSNCSNLKNLTLNRCKLMGMNGISICHPGLASLTLKDLCNDVIVVTPQLKNLTIKNAEQIHLISAPNLCSFRFECSYRYCALELSGDFPHVEKVDIFISRCCLNKKNVHTIASLLQQFQSVKFLILSLEVIKILSLSLELISHQPSPFTNLKSLKIYPEYAPEYTTREEEETQQKLTMSNEVKNYLLDGSSGANFTMVSHEEVRAVRNVALAQMRMGELQDELDRLKENSKIYTTDMYQEKPPMGSHMGVVHEQVDVENNGTAQPETKAKWHFGERVTLVESHLKDLNKQMKKGYKKSRSIIPELRKIEEILTKLPASHRAKLQARFSDLCAEAGTVIDHMMGYLKEHCDKKPRFKCLLS